MPLHRFHLARVLHELVADIKDYLDDVIDALDMVEGGGESPSAVRRQRAAGCDVRDEATRAQRERGPDDERIEALRAEFDRMRQLLDAVTGRAPSKTPAR
ncbi:hypothetical protein [Streptantibioticus cattleyicolor]|nr:hypothetical protein [Streptantibioticus cattleyicolor]CCB71445.1 protein of unknown function [Streptantibioticus cattleyicolor NRRL 8057 = DSM 46488]